MSSLVTCAWHKHKLCAFCAAPDSRHVMYPGQRLSSRSSPSSRGRRSTTKNTFNIFIMKSFGAIMNAWPPRRPTASEVQDTSPGQTRRGVLMNNRATLQRAAAAELSHFHQASFLRWASWGKLQFLFISGHRPGGSCCWPSAAVPNNHNNCAMGVDVVNFCQTPSPSPSP